MKKKQIYDLVRTLERLEVIFLKIANRQGVAVTNHYYELVPFGSALLQCISKLVSGCFSELWLE